MSAGIFLCGLLAGLAVTLLTAVFTAANMWLLLLVFVLTGWAGMLGALFLMERWMRDRSTDASRSWLR
jgi:hypothetical protein